MHKPERILKKAIPCILAILFYSCEKEISIELPEMEDALVVEGRIETGQPPYVILTKSSGYFEATDLNSFLGAFVHGATLTVETDGVIYPLHELCTGDLPAEVRPIAASFLGIRADLLASNNFCVYTIPLQDLLSGNFMQGKEGKTYKLSVMVDGKLYSSLTRIPEIVPLDSVWFATEGTDTVFGFAWARLSEPGNTGNAYRWFTRRINLGSYGQVKDEYFMPPLNSVFDDRFINGESIDFFYDRGNRPSEEGAELEGEKQHYFKTGDTIVVKFCSIDQPVMNFIRKYETEIWNNGNPFASPSSLPTNISEPAIGLWAGYGVYYDTIIAAR